MIFGTDPPRFVGGGTTLDLDYCAILGNDAESVYREDIDEISQDRAFHFHRTDRVVTFLIHLFKYADPVAAYNNLCALIGQRGSLYLHRDGLPFCVSALDIELIPAPFVLRSVEPFFIETADYRDGAVVIFTNCPDATAASGECVLVPIEAWYEADGLPMYDANGKPIFVRAR